MSEHGRIDAALLDRLDDEPTRAAVQALLDRLVELHRAGALDTLCQAAMVLHAARSAATDAMVERLAGFLEQVIGRLGNEGLAELAEDARRALDEAAAETAAAAPRGGLLAMLALLARPEAQRSLAFLLSFGEKLQRRSGEPS